MNNRSKNNKSANPVATFAKAHQSKSPNVVVRHLPNGTDALELSGKTRTRLKEMAEHGGTTPEEALLTIIDEAFAKRKKASEEEDEDGIRYSVSLIAWDGNDGETVGSSDISYKGFISLLKEADLEQKSVGEFIGEILLKAISYSPGEVIRDLVFRNEDSGTQLVVNGTGKAVAS